MQAEHDGGLSWKKRCQQATPPSHRRRAWKQAVPPRWSESGLPGPRNLTVTATTTSTDLCRSRSLAAVVWLDRRKVEGDIHTATPVSPSRSKDASKTPRNRFRLGFSSDVRVGSCSDKAPRVPAGSTETSTNSSPNESSCVAREIAAPQAARPDAGPAERKGPRSERWPEAAACPPARGHPRRVLGSLAHALPKPRLVPGLDQHG